MNHHDHVNLIRHGIPAPGGVWADFGSGTGAFTLALAELIGSAGQLYSIDQDQRALREQARAMEKQFPAMKVQYVTADFSRPLDLPALDGLVMANSLHFHREKDAIIQLMRSYLRPEGRLILVEYNADKGNMWVPYPLSYASWEMLARRNGFEETRLLATVPSRFLGQIYAAVSIKPGAKE